MLAETGTVEQVLSILTGSAVRVNVIEQRESAKTISRKSIIVNDTDKVLIRAHSKVFVHNLPEKIVRQIRHKQLGIGTIIASSCLETFRKIIEVGYNPSEQVGFQKVHFL